MDAPVAAALPFPKSDIERSIVDRFEAVARSLPSWPAVRGPGGVTTYAELSAAADRLARALADRLGPAPLPVALMLDAGAPLFAAMLGVLKAGAFYVPLDPRLPTARLEAIQRGLGARMIVADGARRDLACRLAGDGVPVWTAEELAAEAPAAGGPAPLSPDRLAYVLFTSGSSGEPKGVMQSHRNVLHNVMKLSAGLRIRPDDRLTLLSSPSFGASVSDIFGALLNGASVCPYDLSGDGLRRLPDFLTRESITIYHSVPSVFRSLATTLDGREDLSRLRVVKLGGEPVFANDFELYRRRLPEACRFHVGYGATEINVIRQWSADRDTPWPGGSPLGHAVDETEVVLLDERGAETSGEGEIGVIARTLAVGYWNDPDRTAAAFRPVPGRPGARLYRTGDRGRLLPDGCLLHAGRGDGRLKIRGHRVETAEVEAALLSVAGIAEAAVDGRGGAEGARLVAWIAAAGGGAPDPARLRRALSERLPAIMLPSAFVVLDALPKTRTGKVDRSALPDPDGSRPILATPFVAPRDPTEAAVATAFARALAIERVGAGDDFFDLGGDSLSAVAALAALSEGLGVELSVADLLEAPTPASLAERVRRSGGPSRRGFVSLQEGDRPPVFVVPGGGGDGEDLFVARRLARLVGEFPFFCFRSGPAPHPPAEELAARCERELRAVSPQGPYALVGDCIGGILALLVAHRLRARGEDVALLALLDTPYPTRRRRLRARLLSSAPGADRVLRRLAYFRGRLRYHAGVLRALRGGRLAYALRQTRVGVRGLDAPAGVRGREAARRRASYVGALSGWRPAAYDGTIRLIESDEAAARGTAAAWKRLAADSEVVRVPGDHGTSILAHGDRVAAALRRWLDAAFPRPAAVTGPAAAAVPAPCPPTGSAPPPPSP